MIDEAEQMTGKGYWVEICQEGRRLGAGFLLARCHSLTALHCLRDATPGNDAIDVTFSDGETVPGRIYRRAPEADLALIDIEIRNQLIAWICQITVWPWSINCGITWTVPASVMHF
jgi:hypothetical protein